MQQDVQDTRRQRTGELGPADLAGPLWDPVQPGPHLLLPEDGRPSGAPGELPGRRAHEVPPAPREVRRPNRRAPLRPGDHRPHSGPESVRAARSRRGRPVAPRRQIRSAPPGSGTRHRPAAKPQRVRGDPPAPGQKRAHPRRSVGDVRHHHPERGSRPAPSRGALRRRDHAGPPTSGRGLIARPRRVSRAGPAGPIPLVSLLSLRGKSVIEPVRTP